MHKIWLIISREYLVRVRKKSFIIMTILGPILMAALMIIPIYLANESKQERFIAINEQSEYILEDTDLLHFTQIPNIEAKNLTNDFSESPYYALLYIENNQFTLFSDQQISLSVSKDIKQQIDNIIEIKNLKEAGINPQIIENAKSEIEIRTKLIDEDGVVPTLTLKQVWVLGLYQAYLFIYLSLCTEQW